MEWGNIYLFESLTDSIRSCDFSDNPGMHQEQMGEPIARDILLERKKNRSVENRREAKRRLETHRSPGPAFTTKPSHKSEWERANINLQRLSEQTPRYQPVWSQTRSADGECFFSRLLAPCASAASLCCFFFFFFCEMRRGDDVRPRAIGLANQEPVRCISHSLNVWV